MEKTRQELVQLEFSEAEIERYYIPVITLRNQIDVAHVHLSSFTEEQLQVLYKFTERAELRFRKLLRRVSDKITEKSYELPEYTDLKPRPEAIKTINIITKNFS